MRTVFIIAALALVAGCATNNDTDQVEAVTTPAAPSVDMASQDYLEQLGHRVFFALDEYTLTSQAQSTLQKQAEWMIANPGVRVRLEGNCDERGTKEYNFALGARRAEAARAYLVSLGVAGSRITTVSNGKEKPIAMGSTESAWSQNRNSTTMIIGGPSS